MGTWLNDDGLYIKYGPTSFESTAKGGEFATSLEGQNVVEMTVTLTDLADANAILNDQVKLPENALITQVTIVPTVLATSGGSAVLDIGVIDTDRSSNGDDDALVAALPLASMDTVGETTILRQGDTYHGALVGAELTTSDGVYLTFGYDTAAFTAGVIKVRVFYIPNGVDNP
jgi:hypothetical protein